MIRRNRPLAEGATDWLLIPQREHARLSYELASAWGNQQVPPLVCPPDSPDAALLAVRNELLEAIRLHDEGWAEWEAAPGIEPARGRPYAFTEMPPADAQRLWTASIDRCREIGPLAAWIVAGHFIWLQSDRDEDYPQWAPWLEEQLAGQKESLAQWLAVADAHTRQLADQALFYLRTFDWLSLWFCCFASAVQGDPPAELELKDKPHNFGPVRFDATTQGAIASPWPFSRDRVELSVDALRAPVGNYEDQKSLLNASEKQTICWTIGQSDS